MNADRLARLRTELRRIGVDGFIVPRADEHLGEYVPASAERLAWLTGFTGSAGVAAVTQERACVFSDGRYILQMATQTDAKLWERRHMIEEPPATWLAHAGHDAPKLRIGYDPWLISDDGLKPYIEARLEMVPLAQNPIDTVWDDRPAPPMAPALPHQLEWAGLSGPDKQHDIGAALRKDRLSAAVVSDPASIAWLFNLRGSDVPFTPFALGFALAHADGHCELFMAPEKLPPETRAWLGNGVTVCERSALPGALAKLAGKRVRVDTTATNAWFAQTLRAAGAEVVAGLDPCMLPKAKKNAVEREGARLAHRRDAVAVCRFLRWLESAAGRETEMSAASRLLELRQAQEAFRGESFPAISAAGEHGAIMHYRVGPETNRPLRPNELYLIDSGGQYVCGTTDITRTVWTGPDSPPETLRDHFTRVLKGHIAIATLTFPKGVAGPHIDAFARQALWQVGLDYDHGTGHGVGSFLSVHEGPVSLSRAARVIPLDEGMLLSNEPGYYLPGAYGIRLENLLFVRTEAFPQALKTFFGFETVSLAPFDRRMIMRSLLTQAERSWIDAYHARVAAEIGPLLEGDEREWLEAACRVL